MRSLFTSDVFLTWIFFTVLGVVLTLETGDIIFALLSPHVGALLGIFFSETSANKERNRIFK